MELNKIYNYLSIVFLLICISSCKESKQNAPEQGIDKGITIPFELTTHNNISIESVIATVDTLDLMFHTAASSLDVTTKAVEKITSITWNAQSEVSSWGGKATSRYSNNNAVQIGKILLDSIQIWENKNSGPTTDGKFGPNLFKDYVIEIDYDHKAIKLYDSLPNKVEGYTKMEVRFENDMLFINGTSRIDSTDYTTEFLVHSGYGGAIMFDDKFVLDNKIGDQIEIIDEQELKDSFGNVLKVKKGILPTFILGNVQLTDVPVGFFQGKISRQQISIIGGDVLKRFNIIISADRKNIYLKESELKNIEYTQF